MLRDLNLFPVYDSSEHDLVGDLIVPLLQNSVSYLRGVGFFTSGWLKLAAIGLAAFVENGGKARIILSPVMERSDWEAFQLGDKARHDALLKEILERNLDSIAASLESDTLNTMAWMIADDLLEFRFAIIRKPLALGDYHDKVAAFGDDNGNMVAIHGSFNDSLKGSLNGEAFSVFKSWEEGQRPYVDQHTRRLNQLWDNNNTQFSVFSIPEAVCQKFIQLRSSEKRPYRFDRPRAARPKGTSITEGAVNLYEYQQNALSSWLDSGCKGILDMATGTGKTLTALSLSTPFFFVSFSPD